MSNDSNKKILIIVDSKDSSWIAKRISLEENIDYVILPLGITSEAYERPNSKHLKDNKISFFPIEKIAGQARSNIQGSYPQFMFDLARNPIFNKKSLLDLLAIEDANMWWLMDTSEKSVLRCSLVNHLYFLELISLAIARFNFEEMWISVKCRSLNRALQSFNPANGRRIKIKVIGNRPKDSSIRNASFAVELTLRRLLLFLLVIFQYCVLLYLRIRTHLENTKILLLSSYPIMWRNPLSNKPSDRIYGMLPSVLNQWKKTGYLAIIQLLRFPLWRYRKIIKANFEKLNMVPLLVLGKVIDICSIIHPPYLAKVIRSMHWVKKMRSFERGEFDIAPLIVQEIRCSLSKSELPLNIVWMRSIRRLCEQHAIKFIVHWGEFQPIEKAIWYGSRPCGVKAVSFQHSACTPMFINYHFAAGEIPSYLRYPEAKESMPLPSLFASTGQYAAETLRDAGFPEERIRICGAIRYRGLVDLYLSSWSKQSLRAKLLGLTQSVKVILVAAATKRLDNLNMANSMAAVLTSLTDDVTVLIKCHPLLQMEKEIESIIKELNPKLKCLTFRADVPLHKLIAVSDVMITNSSASGLEAITIGIMSIFFHNPHLYDVSVLYSLQESILLASCASDLEAAFKTVFQDENGLRNRKAHWEENIKNIFYQMDTEAEQRFLAFLKEHNSNLEVSC